jgi:hypothetical protein
MDAKRMFWGWVEMAHPKKIIWMMGGTMSIMRMRLSRKTWVSSFLRNPRTVGLGEVMVRGPS